MKKNVYSKKKFIAVNIQMTLAFIFFSLIGFYLPFVNEGKETLQQCTILIILLTIIENLVMNAYLYLSQIKLADLRQIQPKLYYADGLMSGVFCLAVSCYIMNGFTGMIHQIGLIMVTIFTIIFIFYICCLVAVYFLDRSFYSCFKKKL